MMRRVEDLLKDKIPYGILSNTHGLNGDLKLYLFSNMPELVEKITEAVAYNESQKKFVIVKFSKVRKASDYFIVHLTGIDTISEAEKLKGFIIYLDKSFFPKSKDGEYYFFEILNAEVYDNAGEFIGIVEDIIETGNNDVIVVKKEKEEVLIPVIERYILKIDKEAKKIIVNMPEWLE
ncbi:MULTISPECIES: ribosome maturation factor RimM [Fervidobacterium]|uniref:Ribosome maturation factor RimM n=1 Tax=Fervidobacterium nodosum (strain ATCC 35602 / DSM 5306 / Rt17-B1) TaxID=381764 RepID=RIMM_FERNB|nr:MULTISPECIES: ribosome maturation factor RimM [Fervidobacterium]A7HKS0.1 RecName: Full=Ribosome maturation factor RimM [Fervidobacterium nodosum Rt17-B1]ABS60503.1 16S rRNA processing protein RimM [Fervidobacterium nodosum Rt17-B1]KAF2962532.1 ribosome maturation factor RimM [Fervidobacterium sp. 2310opik-2]PHJ14123.1 ribosome maturation factor RimM [Fervidobacterium sp. SC_NGM5_G05]